MQGSNITYRPIQSSDYLVLEDIIRESWNYDQLGSHKVAKQLAKVYLASCLSNQTFTSVAISNGRPVGVIMGKNKYTYRKSLKYLVNEGLAMVPFLISKEARKIGRIFEKVDKMDDLLLKKIPADFDCELAFFAVDSKERGLGIGKILYKQFLDYMEQEELKTFFLFTDTTCNYNFYEHQGLKRLAEEKLELSQVQTGMEFYLYGNVEC